MSHFPVEEKSGTRGALQRAAYSGARVDASLKMVPKWFPSRSLGTSKSRRFGTSKSRSLGTSKTSKNGRLESSKTSKERELGKQRGTWE